MTNEHGGIPSESQTSDPFYTPENQAYLQKVISDYETGKSKPIVKTTADLKDMGEGKR